VLDGPSSATCLQCLLYKLVVEVLILATFYLWGQVKDTLLKKHAEQIEQVKRQATQFAITQELSKVCC
jgi:hypothetical protein